MIQPPAPIYCRKCGYDLSAGPQAVCPECGEGFDPHDPDTFSRRSRPAPLPWRNYLALLLAAVTLLPTQLAALSAALALASLYLAIIGCKDGPITPSVLAIILATLGLFMQGAAVCALLTAP